MEEAACEKVQIQLWYPERESEPALKAIVEATTDTLWSFPKLLAGLKQQ